MATENYEIKLVVSGQDMASPALSRVNQMLRQTETESRGASNATRGLQLDFDDLKQMALGAATALGGMQILQTVGELNDLGREVRAARNTFTELAGGPAEAAAALEMMRSSTRGTADDLLLMASANKIMLTGISDNADEIARLTGQAIALGSAMGAGPEEAVSNLNAALMNMSYERLDMLGVSSANVRARVLELKDAGLETAAAFNQAVLEQMDVSMQRLGGSIDANATAMDRLSTRIENAKQSLGEFIATGIEAGAMAIEIPIRIIEHNAATGATAQDIQAEATAARAQEDISIAITQQLNADYGAQVGREFSLGFVEAARATFQRLPMIPDDATLVSMIDPNLSLDSEGMRAYAEAAREVLRLQIEIRSQQRAQAELESERNRELERGEAMLARQAAEMERQAAAAAELAAAIPREMAGENMLYLSRLMSDASGAMGTSPYGFAQGTMPEFMTAQGAARVGSMADEAERMLDALEAAREQDIITDDQLASAKEMAGQVRDMADEAQRAADNFKNMSLAQALGQSETPLLGDLNRMIMAQARDSGTYTDAQLQQLQDALELNSGAQNEASLAMRDDIVPALLEAGDKFGSDAMIAALDNLTLELQNAALQRRDPNFANAGFTYNPNASQFEVMPGEGYWSVAQRTGMSMEEVQAITGGGMLHPGTYGGGGGWEMGPFGWLGGGMTPMSFNGGTAGPGTSDMGASTDQLFTAQEIATQTDMTAMASERYSAAMSVVREETILTADMMPTVNEYMAASRGEAEILRSEVTEVQRITAALTAKVHVVRFRFDLQDPNGIMNILKSGVGQIVKDNGGTTPGTDNR